MSAVFRLFPEDGSTLFVRAVVHPTKRAMCEHWRAAGGPSFNGGSWDRRIAYCTEWMRWVVHPHGRVRRDPCVAEAHFYRARLGTEIVTHELFHATMAWGRRIGFDWLRLGADDAVNDDEERLSYVHGALCRQFVDRAYAAGVYP